jgi:hypothetical protein
VVGLIEGFDAAEWPDPPRVPDDTVETPKALERHMAALVRHRRLTAMRDRTWLAQNPHLNDPAVGARYLALPIERIFPFVQDQLSGSGTLGRIVLQRVIFEEGSFISTLPEEVGAEEAVANPQGGGKALPSGPQAHPRTARVPRRQTCTCP